MKSSGYGMMKKILASTAMLLVIVACHSAHAKQSPHQAPKVLSLHTIGQITWHPQRFLNQTVRVQGYLLKEEVGYAIFSDEPAGAITKHDLPVIGNDVDNAKPRQKYILQGKFLSKGLKSTNRNPYHLKLFTTPQRVK